MNRYVYSASRIPNLIFSIPDTGVEIITETGSATLRITDPA